MDSRVFVCNNLCKKNCFLIHFQYIKICCFRGFLFNSKINFDENVRYIPYQLATKEVFNEINLELVDPKACFKSLKRVSASKLHTISPVAPIISINRTDSRFTESYNVADDLNETDNLAAMDWQDFEHLIRELFAKEFSSNGGEVKVTQASRDGGVDAIAFDPDHIRGGKIVIQAKRYTNTVGVSAVRDLYGTVMNEGATKGILVTTSDYGHDAYSFANGKQLTLLNGANLLNLLEKFGHKAKIYIIETKMILKEEKYKVDFFGFLLSIDNKLLDLHHF